MGVWLPTTKSRESTSFRPLNWECEMSLKRSRQGLQRWFRPRCDQTLHSGVMSSRSPKTPIGTISGQFRDSNLGVPRKSAIRVQVRWSGIEYTIGKMVVAPLESGLCCVLWSKVPVACPNTQGCSRMWTNHFVVCFGCRFKLDLLVPLPSLISGLLACPSTPL